MGIRLTGPSLFCLAGEDKDVVSMISTVKVFLASVGLALVVMGGVAVPFASADQCTVTAILLNGTTVTFTVSAPPGTPPTAMLPPGTPPVQSVIASCRATTAPAGLSAPPTAATTVTTARENTTAHSSPPTHTPATTTTHSSPSSNSATDQKTKTASSGLAHLVGSPGRNAKAIKVTAGARVATRRKPQRHPAHQTHGSTHRPDRVPRRSRQSDRPRHRPVSALPAKRQSVSAAVETVAKEPPLGPVKEVALGAAHQQGSSPIAWMLLAGLALAATGLGAAREVGLIRRRL